MSDPRILTDDPWLYLADADQDAWRAAQDGPDRCDRGPCNDPDCLCMNKEDEDGCT